jgi:chromosome partitioning protein
MKIVTLAQRKGGNHKTTASYNLAFMLALKKKKVLLVDLDSQCNLSSLFKMDPLSFDEWKQLQIKPGNKQIDVLAGTKSFERVKQEINERFERRTYLVEEVLAKIKGYDYVIIDTAPALDILNINSFVASNIVLIPINPGKFSIAGLLEMEEIIEKVKQLNKKLKHYIFISGFHTNRNVSEQVREQLKKRFQENYSDVIIPSREYVEKAIFQNKPALGLEEIYNAYNNLAGLLNGKS